MEQYRSFSMKPEDFSMENLWFAMGYKGAKPNEPVISTAEVIIRRLIPKAVMKYMFRIVPANKSSSEEVIIDGHMFTPGNVICSYLDRMTEACVYVATAGREFDGELNRIYAENDVFSSFIADAVGTVLVELAIGELGKELSQRVDVSKSYNPGYCGWDIREQHEFFKLFPEEPCGIILSESSLMSPEKSVSGFFAMDDDLKNYPYHCEICKNIHCYKRRDRKM